MVKGPAAVQSKRQLEKYLLQAKAKWESTPAAGQPISSNSRVGSPKKQSSKKLTEGQGQEAELDDSTEHFSQCKDNDQFEDTMMITC